MKRFELLRRGTPDLPHFECGPFNHLGTSPYISVCFILEKFLERKAGENTEKYSIFYFENPFISRISGGRNDQAALKFRVLHLRPLGQLSLYVIPHFFQKLLERTDGKNNKIFNFRTGENPEFMGFLSGANSQLYKKFRVSPVMTASIRFHIRLKHGKTRFVHTILSVLKEKVKRFLAKRLTYTGQSGYNNCVL